MKKVFCVLISIVMMMSLLTACSTTGDKKPDAEKLSIIATIFPEYDWVKNILGDKADNFDLTLLLDNSIDLHSYQATADDLVKISNCDMFIYVGGESDEWVEDALENSVNPNQVAINLLEVLGDSVKEEEVVEGMEAEEKEAEEGEEGEEEEEVEYDEHVWLSLKNSAVLCKEIASEISEIDSKNKDIYEKNADEYIGKLNELDKKYADTVAAAKNKTVLFGDRFPFRYLADDYGLDYYAAFVGCSAETEASFETIKFLADKVDELGLKTVLTIENSDGKIAQTIVDSAKTEDINIAAMNSLQSSTTKDAAAGVSYLSVMTDNLAVLEAALK